MKSSTCLIISAAAVVVGVGCSLLFRYLDDQVKLDISREKMRLTDLMQKVAEQDSLLRLDSLNLNIVTPDLNFHNLHGRVHHLRHGETDASFDRDGNWTNPQAYVSRGGYTLSFDRNKFGTIIGAHSKDEFEGKPAEEIEYTWDGNLLKVVRSRSVDGEYTIRYTYDHHNLPVTVRTLSKDESGESEVSTTYTYDKFDRYGNWTRRTGRSAIKTTQYEGYYDDEKDSFVKGNSPIIESSEEVDERIISYYN